MEIIVQFLLFSFSILFFFSISTQSANSCEPESCDSTLGPEVRFPFRLRSRKTVRCGYPGFELSCNSKRETILKLPASGRFRVHSIDYSSQTLSMSAPGSCLPSRILGFNLSGSPFRGADVRDYTFLNCSSGREVFDLLWSDPACSYCENPGRVCGFKNFSSLETGCYERARSSGMSRKAKYGLIIGVGIPGLVCIIGLVSHTCGLIKLLCLRRSPSSELPTVMVPDGQFSTNGLDGPTIESYPKTVLGESRRLPEPRDHGTCPICLSEYQPKDTLRSIPECNHYFHVDCIDEWLKLNGTCPLCRNSPDGSTATTCSSPSSLSLITPSSSPSLDNL